MVDFTEQRGRKPEASAGSAELGTSYRELHTDLCIPQPLLAESEPPTVDTSELNSVLKSETQEFAASVKEFATHSLKLPKLETQKSLGAAERHTGIQAHISSQPTAQEPRASSCPSTLCSLPHWAALLTLQASVCESFHVTELSWTLDSDLSQLTGHFHRTSGLLLFPAPQQQCLIHWGRPKSRSAVPFSSYLWWEVRPGSCLQPGHG